MNFPHILALNLISHRSQIFLDSILDIVKGFLFGITLGPAPRQAGARKAIALFGLF